MKIRPFALLMLCLGLALTAPAQDNGKKNKKKDNAPKEAKSDKVRLELQLAKGDKYEQVISMEQQIGVMGMQIPQTMTFTLLNEVLDKDAQNIYTMKVSYKRVQFRQESPMGLMEVDTDQPQDDDNPMAASFYPLKGKSVTMKMKASGEIIDVIDGDPAVRQAMNNTGNNSFPERALSLGETWESSSTSESMGNKMLVKNKSTFNKREGGRAFINISSEIFDDKQNLIGTQSGTLTVEEATGLTLLTDINQDMKIVAQGQEVAVKGKILMSTKR